MRNGLSQKRKMPVVSVRVALFRLSSQAWDSSPALCARPRKISMRQVYFTRKMRPVIKVNPGRLPTPECVRFSFCFSCLYNFPQATEYGKEE